MEGGLKPGMGDCNMQTPSGLLQDNGFEVLLPTYVETDAQLKTYLGLLSLSRLFYQRLVFIHGFPTF